MKRKFVILFAGPAGSSKSPIANYLSWKLNLPLFNTDIINTEMREDRLFQDQPEFERRRLERTEEVLKLRNSIILDNSIDRKYPDIFKKLNEYNYDYFIISLDIDLDFLKQIYKAKEYKAFDVLDATFTDHKNFLKQNSDKVGLSIDNKNFANRLELSFNAVNEWISKRN